MSWKKWTLDECRDAIRYGDDPLTILCCAIAAAEERGRRRGVEERDELLGLLRRALDMISPYDTTLWEEIHRVVHLAPPSSAPECDCDAPMAGGHWSNCATRKPRDSGKENKGPMTSPDSGERWPGGVKPGFVKPDFGEREETIFLPSVLGHLPNSVLLSLPLARRILAELVAAQVYCPANVRADLRSLTDELRARLPT